MNGNNVYNYMNNMSIENNSYTYVSNKNRTKFGKNVVNFIRTNGCEPEKIFSKITNKNNKGGFHLRKIRSTKPIRYSLNKTIAKYGKGVGKLASGSTGVVYIGCVDKSCKKEVAIKQDTYENVKIEYDITNKLSPLSPHITKVYAVNKCGLLYSEYYSGNSIIEWVTANKSHLRPIYIRNMIFQVLYTLRRVQQKYPKFRHNDMHGGNVLVNDRAVAKGYIKYTIDGATYYVKNAGVSASIADFGFADMPGIRNPVILQNHMQNEWGLGPKSHPLYDTHLFLNSMYGMINNVPALSATRKFIESVLPPAYLGQNSDQIQEFRLRYGHRHPGLPTLRKILKNPYFTSIMSKKAAFINAYPQNIKSPSLSKKVRKGMTKMNRINEGPSPSPKKRPGVRRPVAAPKSKTPSPLKSPAGLSSKNMVKFIITDGTKKAQLELTKVFVPGEKLPTKAELMTIMASFAKGQKKLGKKMPPRAPAKRKPRAPQVAPPLPPKSNRVRYPATYANIRRMAVKRGKRSKVVSPAKRKPVSPATRRYNNALRKGVGPSWLLEANTGLIGRARAPRPKPKTPPKKPRAIKFINFSKGKSAATGSIRTSAITRVIPSKNRVILNAADKRRVQALREKISNNLAGNISNFANREKKAYAMALSQVENQKRKLINIGLINEPTRRVINQAVAKATSPIKKINVNKKVSIAFKGAQTTKSGTVKGHTGKASKLLTGVQVAPPSSNYSLNKDSRLKIKGKLCSGYKKDELQEYLRKSGITFTQKATKDEMCAQLKKNIFK
jgi:hypothetical protein